MESKAVVFDWQVESLRLTCFPIPGQLPGHDWWQSVTGELPEHQSRRPREGLTTEEGNYNNIKLVLSAKETRIDWLYVANEGEPPSHLPLIGPYHEVSGSFYEAMHGWLTQEAPRCRRLALGMVLLKEVNSREAGYEHVAGLLQDVKIDIRGSSDLFYQINRPRPSKSESLAVSINRLSRWSVVDIQPQILSLDNSLGRGTPSVIPGDKAYASRLELDINNSPNPEKEFNGKDLGQLLSEFVELGEEIALHGDIK